MPSPVLPASSHLRDSVLVKLFQRRSSLVVDRFLVVGELELEELGSCIHHIPDP